MTLHGHVKSMTHRKGTLIRLKTSKVASNNNFVIAPEGGRRKKLFEFFKTSFSKYLANHNSKMPNLKSSYLVLKR